MKVSCSNCIHCANKGIYCGLCNKKVDARGCREVIGLNDMCEKFSPIMNRSDEGKFPHSLVKAAIVWFSLCFLAASAINLLWALMEADSFSLYDLRFDVILAFSVIAAGIASVVSIMDY